MPSQTGKDVPSQGVHLSQLVVPVCSPHQTCPKVSKPWAIRRRFSFQFRSLQVPGSNQNQIRVTVANQFTAKNISFPPPTAVWRVFCSCCLPLFFPKEMDEPSRDFLVHLPPQVNTMLMPTFWFRGTTTRSAMCWPKFKFAFELSFFWGCECLPHVSESPHQSAVRSPESAGSVRLSSHFRGEVSS